MRKSGVEQFAKCQIFVRFGRYTCILMSLYERFLFFLLLILFLVLALTRHHKAHAYFTTFERTPVSLSLTDWTIPSTTVFYQNTQGLSIPVKEFVVNGLFEDGLQGWSTTGKVKQFKDHSIQIGNSEDSGQEITINTVSQTIPNKTKNLTFSYQVLTKETQSGFDDPAFEVRINNIPMFAIKAEDIPQNGEIKTTGWKQATIDLSSFTQSSLTITFSAGNTVDNLHQSWAMISQVTTTPLAINATSLLNLSIEDNQPSNSFIAYDAYNNTSSLSLNQPFSFSSPLENNLLRYWSKDATGNLESSQALPVFFNAFPPDPVSNLFISNEGYGEYVLQFTTPSSVSSIASYDVRYSRNPIESYTDLESLPLAHQAEESLHAPTLANNPEQLFLDQLNPQYAYFFAIRTIDINGNISQLVTGGSL